MLVRGRRTGRPPRRASRAVRPARSLGGCNSEVLPGLPLVGRGLQLQDGEKVCGEGVVSGAVPLPGVRVCAR